MTYNPGIKSKGSQMQNHLLEIICQGDETEFRHLEGTIADMIQRPYEVSGVAHVFYGGQGTGKSILGALMKGLIGAAQVMEFNDVATYFSRFNVDHLKIFEELSDKGDGLINNNKLKADITKHEIRIEVKGAAILKMRHLARLWFISNHRHTIHIEHDDRRYTYHKSSSKYADNAEYFDPLWASVKDPEYLRSCFEYFAELEYDPKFVRKALSTNEKKEQTLDSLSMPLKFLNDFMFEELDELASPLKIGDRVQSHEVYQCTQTVLAKIFEEAKILDLPERHRTDDGKRHAWYTINMENVLIGFRRYLNNPNFEFRPAGTL